MFTGIKTEVVHVSPAIAEEWLKNNKNNRNLRPSVINSYAKDMMGGSGL